ncbi:MAG: phosphoribosylaminoimidazolecarboxamide formyltransferase / cyclohydrolase [Thermoplasmata archaeon]|jgi:phosphoribosylaminoimidazolecarboxamide formyltransferase/IMP cyclohydrolase|nr:phosphoribosylaminoimidazolecarboxamide formyltransferase / cyclohydrolase [Thermoplasmata archaeon]
MAAIPAPRALLSVSDKTGLVEFATRLSRLGLHLVSTGGTAKALRDAGLAVQDVSELTGFPEMMEGRVKTLHPNIAGGILAKRDDATHTAAMQRHGMVPIDVVAVNLYPFEEAASKDGASLGELVEQIDIGGPSLVRAAAKNHAHVLVVTDPAQYGRVAEALEAGKVDGALRQELALRAFQHTARYDAIIARALSKRFGLTDYPEHLVFAFDRRETLRYGENDHQRAAFYEKAGPRNVAEPSIIKSRQLHGKQLSYNNILDADVALECVKEFPEKPTCVIVKHATPCGIATAATLHQAYQDALACDPYSPFGGIVAVNRRLDLATAQALGELFLEIIVAPGFAPDALAHLQKKKNLRLLEVVGLDGPYRRSGTQIRSVTGGLLVQDRDLKPYDTNNWKTVTKAQPSTAQLESLLFAARCVKYVRSNAVVFVQGTRTVGIGGGQTARVDSTFIATHKGADRIQGSVLASDAFFPFRDAVDVAAKHGVAAIVQPGGSIRDAEVIQAADEHGIAMVFSGQRSFRH